MYYLTLLSAPYFFPSLFTCIMALQQAWHILSWHSINPSLGLGAGVLVNRLILGCCSGGVYQLPLVFYDVKIKKITYWFLYISFNWMKPLSSKIIEAEWRICVGNPTIIGSDNGLSPSQCQAIIWTNARILLIGPLGTNFSEILIEIHTFSFKKMHVKRSSAKWRPFCHGLIVFK